MGEVYLGVRLVAVDKDILSRPRAQIWISATPSQSDQAMQLIRACNPNLPTVGWRFIKAFNDPAAESSVETKRATMQIMMLLTKESVEPLAKISGEINYGFTQVEVRGDRRLKRCREENNKRAFYMACCVGKAWTCI